MVSCQQQKFLPPSAAPCDIRWQESSAPLYWSTLPFDKEGGQNPLPKGAVRTACLDGNASFIPRRRETRRLVTEAGYDYPVCLIGRLCLAARMFRGRAFPLLPYSRRLRTMWRSEAGENKFPGKGRPGIPQFEGIAVWVGGCSCCRQCAAGLQGEAGPGSAQRVICNRFRKTGVLFGDSCGQSPVATLIRGQAPGN